MIKRIPLSQILVVDIETVPVYAEFEEVSPKLQELFIKKNQRLRLDEEEDSALWKRRAGLQAEFAKVICISVGIWHRETPDGTLRFRVKSYKGKDESSLLNDFSQLLESHFPTPRRFYICGHNIKEFDVPFLCRRMLINRLPLPRQLDIGGKKPWEVPFIDTLELWKFGDYKHYTSLALLCHSLGVPSSKSDMDGSMVQDVFYKDKDLDRIAKYCREDVLAVARLVMRFRCGEDLEEEQVETAEN